ncbi:hypothetical protein J2T18_004556 [Paenibacillus polymyxa]|nr:hypothetical protein [Paenibacillus polymyxa]
MLLLKSEDELPVPVIESHIKQFARIPQAVATDRIDEKRLSLFLDRVVKQKPDT